MHIEEAKTLIKLMSQDDQKVRDSYPIKKKEMDELDAKHAKFMKALINEFGVIDIKRFGEETAKEAALLVQHSTYELRKKYLELQDKFPKDNIYKRGYVYLKDRVLIEDGKPQLYGTQLKLISKEGKLAFNPIENIKEINKIRTDMGLETFEEYLKTIEKNTGQKPEILQS